MDTINIGAYGFLEAIGGMTIEVKLICMKFATLFAVITASYGVIRFFLGFEDGQKIDFKKYVWTPLITIFLLVNYSYLIDITDSISSLLINSIPSAKDKSVLVELLNNSNSRFSVELEHHKAQTIVTDNDPNKTWYEKIGSGLLQAYELKNQIQSMPVRWLGKSIEAGWMSFCRLLIENVRGIVLGFLVIVGPIAILLSILPLYSDMTKKWYKMYVAVLLWAITINVLDAVIISYSQHSVDISAIDNIDPDLDKVERAKAVLAITEPIVGDYGGQATFIHFAFGLMYLTVPLLTAFFAGDKMAAGVLSFVMMKTVDFAIKAGSAVVTGGKSMIGSKIGGGGGGGDTSGME